VPGDTNEVRDLFVKDLVTGSVVRVNTDSLGNQSNFSVGYGDSDISDDGRYVVFADYANDLVSGDTNGRADVFLKDLVTGAISLVSTSSTGTQGNGHCSRPFLSGNGRYVAFASAASNLLPGDPGPGLFVKDVLTGALQRVDADASGIRANSFAQLTSISADGRFVAFLSTATNLVPNDTNGKQDLFVKDVMTGAIVRANTDSASVQANGDAFDGSMSNTGLLIAFRSTATNLVNYAPSTGVYVKNLLTGEIRLLSHITSLDVDQTGNAVSLSGDGELAVFCTSARDLVPSDFNDFYWDVFLVDTGFQLPPNPSAGGPYLLLEGQALTLDASATTNPTGYPLTFTWDVNGDGLFGDATGMTPTLSWSQLNALGISNGPSSFQVRVRVDDSHGHVLDSAPVSLTVHNVAPILSNLSLDQASLHEGDMVTLTGVVTDPGNGETFTLTVTWGDGQTETVTLPFTTATAGQPFSLSHRYEDNPDGATDTLPISVSLSDGDGGTATGSLVVVVHNVAPVLSNLTLNAPQFVEGDTVTLSGLLTDPGAAENFTMLVNWGDGSSETLHLPYTEARNGRAFSLQHQYLDDPVGSDDHYPIIVQVTDGEGGTVSGSTSILVTNAAPTLAQVHMQATILDEGGTALVSGVLFDSGRNEAFTLHVTWGDGQENIYSLATTDATHGLSFTYGHVYRDNAVSYPIQVFVADAAGAWATAQTAITVRNVPPTLESLAVGPDLLNEGQSVSLSGRFHDPALGQPSETFRLEVAWGDGNSDSYFVSGGAFGSLQHRYQNNPTSPDNTYILTATLWDDDGDVSVSSLPVRVTNLAPVVDAFTATAGRNAQQQGSVWHPLTFTVTFQDASWGESGLGDRITAQFDWDGDGSFEESQAVTIQRQGGRLILFASHTYDTAGRIAPWVRLLDQDGGQSQAVPLSGGPLTLLTKNAMLLEGNLVIAGTTGNDLLRVNTSKPNAVTVTLGTTVLTNPTGGKSFDVRGGRVIVYGGPGNDQVFVTGSLPTELHGGEGNDTLQGSSGADVIFGEHGDDLLRGMTGRDVLLGGLGRDVLRGGADQDILVGGPVGDAFGYNRLRSLADAWATSQRDSGPVAAELTALAQATFDAEGTAEFDQLFGEAGRDALLYRLSGTVKDGADFVTGTDVRRTF
jgi:hypothetical protein